MPQRQPRYSKGQRIGNRFLVHQALMGGMGEVYLCLDEQKMRPLALKTFQGSSPDLFKLFKKEVATWIALENHPNIVRCFGMQDFDNIPFVMLEWVAGEEGRGTDLRSWLRHGPLDLSLALRFTIDIVRGLIHANDKSPAIVHRDLKPDNVLVSQSRQAKITDFGLAKLAQRAKLDVQGLDEADLGQSRFVGSIVGTPAYMPPEQWRGDADIDFRADVYAVGCILYELLTGRWVYDARTVSELRDQHLESPVPTLNSPLPAGLQPILDSCLAKRREDRFEHLAALLTELMQVYGRYSDDPLPEVTAEAFDTVDHNNRGVTFANLGQYERAIADYDAAIRLDPTSASAYSNRGNSYAALGQHERAIADYDAAIRLDPTFATAYSNRGTCYGELGQQERAIADYDAAIRLDPTLASAYAGRANRYADLGQYERAIANYDDAIRLDPTFAKAYYSRGSSYADLGQKERAIVDFDAAIRLDPNYAPVYTNRGISYSVLRQHERAIADYDAAIRLDPTQSDAYFNKGVLLANTGRLHESLPLFEQAFKLGHQRALDVIQQVRQVLGLPRTPVQANPNDSEAAVKAFQLASSLDTMRQAVQQFPILAQIIPAIAQVIQQQIPPEQRPAFEHRLAWLRQIVEGK